MAVFLRWVGGKRDLIPQYGNLIPRDYESYHEPFLGGGAMFFHLHPKRSSLGDANADLVRLYQAVRDTPDELVSRARRHRAWHSPEYYQACREAYNSQEAWPLDKSALFLYLNATGFNGLYRVNKKGEYNVPMGNPARPVQEDAIKAASQALQGVSIRPEPYQKVLDRARSRDLVFMDPPYAVAPDKKGFTAYAKSAFADREQEALFLCCEELHRRGCYVMLANSDVPLVRRLWGSTWRYTRVWRGGRVSSKVASRQRVGEVLCTNY